MRILIHSNGPHVPTGYGQQCNLLVRQLKSLGHQVAVSCMYGLAGQPIRWNDITLFPQGRADFSPDVLAGHAESWNADTVITLMDFRKLAPIARVIGRESWDLLAWMPIDTHDKLGEPDREVLAASQALPIAMSRHALRLLREAGFGDAQYAPHSVDTTVFKPPADRDQLRRDADVDGRFVIGINAANMDGMRKGFPEQFEAFARFHSRHPDSLLMLHTQMVSPRGHNLFQMIDDFGLGDAVKITDQYVHTAGLMSPERMADWYGACDVLSLCSYAEGFGIPLIEAQACGVPVVTTSGSAMAELGQQGWTVFGDPFWNAVHRAHWIRPRIEEIEEAYDLAYEAEYATDPDAVEFAAQYETGLVARANWKPILDAVEARRAGATEESSEDAQ